MDINELTFEQHPIVPGGKQAIVVFQNGYRASIIIGGLFRTTVTAPYELAVLDGTGDLACDVPIEDNPLGDLTEADANEILTAIEALPPQEETE